MSAFKAQLSDDPFVPPFQRHSDTSRQAAQSIAKNIGPMHERVLAYLKNHPQGATDEQIIDGTGLGQTARPRRIELQQRNLIKDSGRYALTRSGRRATLWCLR